jgi:hypothetical protein
MTPSSVILSEAKNPCISKLSQRGKMPGFFASLRMTGDRLFLYE